MEGSFERLKVDLADLDLGAVCRPCATSCPRCQPQPGSAITVQPTPAGSSSSGSDGGARGECCHGEVHSSAPAQSSAFPEDAAEASASPVVQCTCCCASNPQGDSTGTPSSSRGQEEAVKSCACGGVVGIGFVFRANAYFRIHIVSSLLAANTCVASRLTSR